MSAYFCGRVAGRIMCEENVWVPESIGESGVSERGGWTFDVSTSVLFVGTLPATSNPPQEPLPPFSSSEPTSSSLPPSGRRASLYHPADSWSGTPCMLYGGILVKGFAKSKVHIQLTTDVGASYNTVRKGTTASRTFRIGKMVIGDW